MIRIKRYWVVCESTTMEGIDPSALRISEEDVKSYLQANPMPEDPAYSRDDLIHDLARSSGTYVLPDGIRQETRDYIEDMLNTLAQ